MIAQTVLSSLLILALLAGQTTSSAVKGHASQQAQTQRLGESIKSAQQQQQPNDRQPKSALSQPILESSKKVYNDESIRRSAAIQQQYAQAEPAAKSAPVVIPVVPVSPVAPVVAPVATPIATPVAQPAVSQSAVPVVASKPAAVEQAAPVPIVAAKPEEPIVVSKKVEQVEPKSAPIEQQQPKAEAIVKPAEEKEPLPAESVRSAPIKEEPNVVEQSPSRVIVEQVVPAKQAPVAAEQPAAPVVAVVAPASSPVVEQVKPVVVEEAAAAPIKPIVADSPLEAKKDEQPIAKEAEPAPIEVPAPDPGLVLSEPIDSTTKLLIDLDEHVQKFLPAEDKQEPSQPAKESVLVSGIDYSPASADQQPSGKSNAPLVPYSSSAVDHDPIVPPLPQAIDKVEKAAGSASPSSSSIAAAAAPPSAQQANTRQASHHQNQNQQQVITQLLDQLDSLQNRIQDTINQLVARRRYVMSALLRPMGTYVRRVRTNLERLQNRVNQLQAAAVSVGGNQNGQRPGGFVDAAAIETIRRRIDDISKRISDIVNRIRFSLTPTSAPLNNNGRK